MKLFKLTQAGFRTAIFALFTGVFATTAVAGGHGDHKAKKYHKNKQDIVQVAASNDSFSTLVAAVKAAGLVETLQDDGPFTVFAPTNEAFNKLPEGTVEMLLKPENKDKLVSVLTYHVVPGKVLAKDVVEISQAKTVQGSKISIGNNYGSVTIDNATVLKTDIKATNGVIHVIDTVIIPENLQTAARSNKRMY